MSPPAVRRSDDVPSRRQTVLLALLLACTAVSLALPAPAAGDETDPAVADQAALAELEGEADDLEAAESWRSFSRFFRKRAKRIFKPIVK